MNATMADHFGGSDAEGRWSVRDAHAALELAQVMFLAQATEFSPAMSSSFADEAFTHFERLVPTQSNRSDEQIERSEEHTSELQSLMRISYAVFCLKKKKKIKYIPKN